jgi:hypothetical protein
MLLPSSRVYAGFFALIILFLFSAQAVSAQVGGGLGSGDRIEGKTKFLPIPYVNYNRSQGYVVGGVPMLMFNPVEGDTLSPSSMAGAFGIYTENKTWMVGAFTKLFLNSDTWRITAAAGTGSVNFQFFIQSPVSKWLPYNTEIDFALVAIDRRVWGDLFLGASYSYTQYITSVSGASDSLSTTLHGLGVKGSMDRRSSQNYPRSGFLAEVEYTAFPSGLGNDFDSDVVEFDFNYYLSTRSKIDVLAMRAYAGVGIGDVSFNQQFIVGSVDIRGYTQGEYRGNNMLAVQGEYRWNFRPRFGLVGFAGIATVIEAVNKEDDWKPLPGVGAGFRYTVETETHMNVGVDIAVGLNDWAISFRISEAF